MGRLGQRFCGAVAASAKRLEKVQPFPWAGVGGNARTCHDNLQQFETVSKAQGVGRVSDAISTRQCIALHCIANIGAGVVTCIE